MIYLAILVLIGLVGFAIYKNHYNKLKNEFDESRMKSIYESFILKAKGNGYNCKHADLTLILEKRKEDNKRAVSINIFQLDNSEVEVSYKLYRNGWSPITRFKMKSSEVSKELFDDINDHYESILI